MQPDRPPLGLMPESICTKLRISAILQAIWRYADANKSVPVEWIDELKTKVCFEKESK